MNKAWIVALLAACTVYSAQAQSDASVALSLLPVASVVGAVSVAGAASAAVAVPVALSVTGATLTVVAVENSIDGTVYLLERASDGARASVRLAGRAVGASALGIGTLLTVVVIGSGVVLSAAGEMVAFLPNAIGRALLHNERLM